MRCKTCKTDKPETEFYKEPRNRTGLNSVCKDCVRSRNKTYVYAPQSQPSAEVKRRSLLKNIEARRAWEREYVQRPESKARRAKYMQENREKLQKWTNDRRTRLASAEGSHSVQEWLALCAFYGNRCVACGAGRPLTRDHVVSLFEGGTNYIDNIQPLCRSCNASKGRKIIDYRIKEVALNAAE